MKSVHRLVLLGTLLLPLAGCQLLPAKEEPKPAVEPVAAEPQLPFQSDAAAPRELDADLVYSYLVAEMAAHRGELALSYRHYMHAATIAHDPYAAERATRIAVYLNDKAGALRAARRWVELSPNAQNARMSLALLLERDGKRQAALDELEALLTISEALSQDGYVQIGRVLAKENAEKMRPLMRELVGRHDQDPRAHFGMAIVALAAKALSEAEESLKRVVSLTPKRHDAWAMLAQVQQAQGRTQQALDGLAKAVADMPDSLALRTAYARLLVDAGRHSEALKQFRLLLDKTPEDSALVYAVAMLAMHEESWEEARGRWQDLRRMGGDRYQEATYFLGQVEERLDHDDVAAELYGEVDEGPLVADAVLRLARLDARHGRVEQARQRLSRLRVLVPERAVDAYLAEAEILKDAGSVDQASDLLDAALEHQPENLDLRYGRAMFAVEQGDLVGMEADLRYILSKDPDHVESLNALGYTLADRTDRYQEAFALIMHAYRLQPESAAILDSLGWVYYRLGDYANALKYLRQALAMVVDAEIAAHLGEVLWVTGDQKQARSIWKKGLEKTPDSKHILDAKKRLE